ncbi:hypothetical protein KRX57_10650 [Weeksellaceae bacterium TAE3-ERU29]|nr:hypothetical protein [Weeksellaceae bacterium TAE3-ERU29]
MKKIFYLLIFLGIGFVNAQEELSTTFKKNEISINAFRGLFDKYPEISYERILTEKFGLGATVGFNYKEPKNYYFSTYMNYYPFGSEKSFKNYASNVFIQPGIYAVSQEYEKITLSSIPGYAHVEYPTSTNVGVSMTLGLKLIFKNNWVGSMHVGGGINIWEEAKESPDGYFISGISIGKRF